MNNEPDQENITNPCGEISISGYTPLQLKKLTGFNMINNEKAIANMLLEQQISKKTLENIDYVKKSSVKLRNFFGILNKIPKIDMAICGGAVRDWHLGKEPKDIDIILDCSMEIIECLTQNFDYVRSSFNGYMFNIDGVKIDIWRLPDSWIFTQKTDITKCWTGLIRSFPLNIDGIMVFGSGEVLECGFYEALNTKQIELMNSLTKNPISNIVQRGIRFSQKYDMAIGPMLQAEIKKHGIIDLGKFTTGSSN